jgi:hypothetical protein
MDTKTKELRATVDRYEKAMASARDCQALKPLLEAEEKKLLEGLDGLPVEAFALPQGASDHFDVVTTKKLRSISDLRTKLALLPNVTLRKTGEAESLRQQIQTTVKAIVRQCRDRASAQIEELRRKLASDLLTQCGGDADRASKAAAAVVAESEAQRWWQEWQFWQHDTDPVMDVANVIDSAERFSTGQPVN